MRRAVVLMALLAGLSLAGCGPCGFGLSGSGTPLACRAEPSPTR